jgi:peptidoglycan/LPS O-acetylase OafA/YrhL
MDRPTRYAASMGIVDDALDVRSKNLIASCTGSSPWHCAANRPSLSNPQKMFSEIKKYPFIDALRGYAIILVVLAHSGQAVQPESQTLQALMNFGAHGVQLFFIASSITLCLSWYGRKSTEQSPVRNFFIRRIFRIVPMYWLAIAFYLTLYGLEPRYWAPNGLNWYSIPLTAMFLNGYSPENINALVPGGWSVAVEVNFYLLFPALLAVTYNLQRSLFLVLLTIGLSQIAIEAFSAIFDGAFSPKQNYIAWNFLSLNFFNQAPVFAIGISTYFLISNPKISRISAIASAAVLAGILILVAVYQRSAFRYLGGYLPLTATWLAMIAVALHSFPTKALVNKPLEYMGKISFSLYLVHFSALFYLDKFGVKASFQKGNISSICYFLIVLTSGCIIATIFHVWVERPGIRLGTRVIHHLESQKSGSHEKARISPGDA